MEDLTQTDQPVLDQILTRNPDQFMDIGQRHAVPSFHKSAGQSPMAKLNPDLKGLVKD